MDGTVSEAFEVEGVACEMDRNIMEEYQTEDEVETDNLPVDMQKLIRKSQNIKLVHFKKGIPLGR